MATLAGLIPFSELAPGQAARIRDGLIAAIVQDVSKTLRIEPPRLIVRDIRAKDDLALYSAAVAAGVEDWGNVTGTTANAYETLATGTSADQRWIGIYGVKITQDCGCTALKFHIGGADKNIWQLQVLRDEDDYTGLCMAGIVIPQNIPYTISRFVRQASSPALIILKGFVVEPRGKVISP